MSGIKFKVGSEEVATRGTGSGSGSSRSEEIKRSGEVSKPQEALAAAAGKQALEREAAGTVSVSDRAAQVGKLIDKVKNAPDIRQERVEALRREIESGEYNPPALDIADAILKNET